MGSFGSKGSVTVFAAIGLVMPVAFFGVVLGAPPPPAPKEEMGEMEFHLADKIKWQDGPASLPKGAMIAVLEGDPAKEGPFVFRIKLPDGFRVQPHTHPKSERVTVISGTLMLGMGDKFEEKAAKEMPAGAYGHWPAGMKHFAWSKGETILQLHGTGPWSVQYLNPDDDTRNQKK